MNGLVTVYGNEVAERLEAIQAFAMAGGLEPAVDIFVEALEKDGIIQAFGTGHSQSFAMEIAGRAGGLVPTHAMKLEDLVLLGHRPVAALGTPEFERDPTVADELYDLYDVRPTDAFIIASNSGANGSTVGMALRAKREGHPVIAVTSLEHTRGVTSRHPSGKRLYEVADVVLDNLAPFGDAVVELSDGTTVGAISSITSEYLAQLLTIEVAARLGETGIVPPLYISANVPVGDEHNNALITQYGARIQPYTGSPAGG